VAGTGPEPAEAGSARLARRTGDMGRGGESKEGGLARGLSWAGPKEHCKFSFNSNFQINLNLQ
jgi:hypothetical protein